jgi:ABC-type sulfate transport system substrate-binding protein
MVMHDPVDSRLARPGAPWLRWAVVLLLVAAAFLGVARATVAKNADRKGTTKLAEAHLQFSYARAAQEIFVRRGLRVVDTDVAAAHAADFPPIKTFVVDDAFGGWTKAQAEHFATGGTFDKIVAELKR